MIVMISPLLRSLMRRSDTYLQMNDSKERVVTPSAVNNVTVEEIDQALLEIAAHNDESSAEVRASKSHINFDSIDALGNLYQRLRSREAKWLTRLILKDFGAVKFPDELKCGPNIRSLPQCVLVEAKFKSSMPESERRDGPGRMRLGAAAKAYLPTPPTTAIKPLSLETTISPYTPSTTIDGNDSSSIITASSSLLSTFYNAASSNIGTPRCPSSARAGSSRRVSIATGYTGATRNRESPETLSPIRQRSPSPMSRLSRLSRRCSPRQTKYSQRSIASPGRGMVKTMGRYQKRLDSISVCGNGRCQLTKGSCPLRNCIFLLAPCISDEKWITEKLFRWHGSRYVRSPEAFTSPDSSDIFGRSSQTGKAYQRIVLVEPRKMEQTVDFLRQVEYLNSGTSGPQRRSVDVYDWRILECIAKIDRGQGSAHKSWSKYRICEI